MESSTFWTQILEHAHNTDHEGVDKILARVRVSFFCYRRHGLFVISSGDVSYARGARKSTSTRWDCSSHSMFPMPSGLSGDIVMDFVEGFPRLLLMKNVLCMS
jgi:hypothetical protein